MIITHRSHKRNPVPPEVKSEVVQVPCFCIPDSARYTFAAMSNGLGIDKKGKAIARLQQELEGSHEDSHERTTLVGADGSSVVCAGSGRARRGRSAASGRTGRGCSARRGC